MKIESLASQLACNTAKIALAFTTHDFAVIDIHSRNDVIIFDIADSDHKTAYALEITHSDICTDSDIEINDTITRFVLVNVIDLEKYRSLAFRYRDCVIDNSEYSNILNDILAKLR